MSGMRDSREGCRALQPVHIDIEYSNRFIPAWPDMGIRAADKPIHLFFIALYPDPVKQR
jgi:hypothetical protein